MFAEMRTGSNFLEANLNALPGVLCHGEVFNPHFIGKKDQLSLFDIDLAARVADPLAMLRRLRQMTDGLSGIRFFHDHDPRVMAEVLADPRCAKIILTRNPVESYVSLKIAQETGQWRLTNVTKAKSGKARFDPQEFETHLKETQEFQITLMHGLQTSGQTAFYIDYEDIQDVDVLNGLAAFLGVEARLDALDNKLKKQNPEEISEKVTNLAEMEMALSRLDRFNLSRTPNFEPRRSPYIPSFVAAAGAPLLHMPIKSGPEAQVNDWLSRLGTGGLIADFNQKSLRQWLRGNAPHRSFAVLRHPVARAHAAYCAQILGGGIPDMRATLTKSYKIDLPKADSVADLAAHRAGFLGFLGWLKLSLSGQTGQKIAPYFATQTAVLQGFAQFQGPDIVLREDRLREGLAYLAAEIGITAPDFTPAAEDTPFALAQVYTAEVEAATRDAYLRDYVGYGFAAWQ